MKDAPIVKVWWCGRGCGAEIVRDEGGVCPRCGKRLEDLGWRQGWHSKDRRYYSAVSEFPKAAAS